LQKDGRTLREHLQSVVKQGITPKELQNLVEIPESMTQCWNWFLELNSTRSSGMGLSPITFSEILAYFTVMQIEYQPWEVEIIKMFDRVALEVTADQQAKAQKSKSSKS